MTPALKSLYEFEKQADRQIRSLGIWKLPLRSILSAFFLGVDRLYDQNRPEQAGALISDVSALCPLLRSCTLEIGESAEDALSVIQTQEIAELRQATIYAQLCKLMPEVRQGWYDVKSVKRGFRLTYPSVEYQHAEEFDFILHEMGKATDASPLRARSREFTRLVRTWPILDPDLVDSIFHDLYELHSTSIREPSFLPIDAYQSAFGFSRQEFNSVRSGLFAIGSFSNGMHFAAAEERDKAVDQGSASRFHTEYLEWDTPILTAGFFFTRLLRMTQLPHARIEAVLAPLTLNAFTRDFGNAGDGYLPPVVRFNNDTILFNPYALRLMTHERNLLYVINRRHRERFDNIVSRHLEPMLLEEAIEQFGRVPGWLIRKNVLWAEGEIDLLAFDVRSNSVMQIQAKAAIPAQNARMTRQLEDHTVKAISQLKRVVELPAAQRDAIVSRAFGQQVQDGNWISAILSRSGLGTWRSWSLLGDIIPLNIPLLGQTLSEVSVEHSCPMTRVPVIAMEILNRWAQQIIGGWQDEKIELCGKTIHFPRIITDDREVARVKAQIGIAP